MSGTVLVTGADGFIGSNLVERLVADGVSVRAFCMYNPQGSWGWLDYAGPAVRGALDVRLGDIRDAGFVAEACRGVDVILHLAALIAIPYSYAAPESFVATNVQGTLNVLEAARRHGVKRVVHTSTSEVYGTPTELPIRETHPLNAQSPYAATKVAADQMALAYHRTFGTPVTVLRPFNTYGPRQSTRAIIPTILTQLLEGKRDIQLGRLDTKRDLTFVGDTVDGFVRAAFTSGLEGRTVQLGVGRAVTIAELFAMACRAVGVEAQAKQEERRLRPDASEVLVLESDPSLAGELLGWKPTVSLEEGLRRTAEWLGSNLTHYRTDYFHV
ncbi:MAG TPA: GDP-mannose 4,6-dehydratase [Polyangia bacterium]|nr:GDP-mannose 4,6-dehydratase [Polyangia bacterium]